MHISYSKLFVLTGLSFISSTVIAGPGYDLFDAAFGITEYRHNQAALYHAEQAQWENFMRPFNFLWACGQVAWPVAQKALYLPVACIKATCSSSQEESEQAALDTLKGIGACILIGGGLVLIKKWIEQSQSYSYIVVRRIIRAY
jgi:hypothetical protein